MTLMHKKTLEKILLLHELPRHKEAVELIEFSERNFANQNGVNEQLFGRESIMVHCEDEISRKHFDKSIFHILTHEFVHCVAEEIKKSGYSGVAVEIAAGKGKLSYWLKRYGIDIIPTDSENRGNNVAWMNASCALNHYKPEIVVTSWLPAGVNVSAPYLQKEIIDTSTVKFYIEIGPDTKDERMCPDDSGKQSHRSALFSRDILQSAQKYSLPINLFSSAYSKKWTTRGLEKEIEGFCRNSSEYLMKHPSIFAWKIRE